MPPRRRSQSKREWPAHLYERGGYYSWRNPQTREEFGLGRDKTSAFAQAVEANIHLAGLTQKTRLIDKLTGSGDRSMGKWIEKYEGLLDRQGLAKETRKSYKSMGNRMVRMFGDDTPVSSVTPLMVSVGLEGIVAEGKARTAQAMRVFMRLSFAEACVQGWCTVNPVLDTRLRARVEVRRTRLTLPLLLQICQAVQFDWLKNAIALALVSGQRREDIAKARFKDFHDGGWWCQQASAKSTNPHRVFIPLELKLEVFGMSLGDVVSQCRRTGIASQYLVHQTQARGKSPVGQKIVADTLSNRFADAVEALGMNWAPKTPPTFHEIRSLSERLYAAQGGVNTQELLGHDDAATTALYHDSRGSEWVRIKIGEK